MTKQINPDSLGFLISDIARIMRGVFSSEIEAADLPVTAAESRVLAHMSRCGATRQHLLADSLGMAPMSLTGFLDRLELAGLIVRGPDPSDRRAKIVSLTEAAPPILAKIAEAGRRAEAKLAHRVSDADFAHFREVALALRSSNEPKIALATAADSAPKVARQKETA